MKNKTQTEQELDSLLSTGLLKAPHDFSNQVLHQIALEPPAESNTQLVKTAAKTNIPRALWHWFVLGTASYIGVGQVTAFIFGVWTATAAG